MEVKEITPLKGKVEGRVSIPGSKSMTHRALLMAALSRSPSVLKHPLKSEDTLYTAKALEQLGCIVEWRDERDEVFINPEPMKNLSPRGSPISIFVGNSGTTMRLLIGFLSTVAWFWLEGKPLRFIIDGSNRMRERPVGPVMESLKALGVRGRFLEKEGFPPVEIVSGGLSGGKVVVDARKSSQFLSALLLSAPCARDDVIVSWLEPVASYPYVEMTLKMMKERGIAFRFISSVEIFIPGNQIYNSGIFVIEGDCSSASYFWATAAISGGRVVTEPIFKESYQGDIGFLTVLERMGCKISRGDNFVEVVGPEELKSIEIDMNHMPDMVPTLSVLSAFARGKSVIKNIGHLRLKESDRIMAVSNELKKLGVRVEDGEDWLVIHGGGAVKGALIDTYDDHRIAMAFSLAGLKVPGVRIKNPSVVRKSFPDYWSLWERFVYG